MAAVILPGRTNWRHGSCYVTWENQLEAWQLLGYWGELSGGVTAVMLPGRTHLRALQLLYYPGEPSRGMVAVLLLERTV